MTTILWGYSSRTQTIQVSDIGGWAGGPGLLRDWLPLRVPPVPRIWRPRKNAERPMCPRPWIRGIEDRASTSGSARDAVHLATMQLHGINRILSFDRGFHRFPEIIRLS